VVVTDPRLLDAGKRVAERFVSDHMGSAHRSRPLAEHVADALQHAEQQAEARADARYSALLDRIAAVVEQRQDLAADKDRRAERLASVGNDQSAQSFARWATELRSQVDAIRSTLDPAEAAEVGLRVEALRAAREDRP
jgi:hypothetical protein